jgi:hypothetical protein
MGGRAMSEQNGNVDGQDSFLEQFRSAAAISVASVKLDSLSAVEQYFGRPDVGALADLLQAKLPEMVGSAVRTGFDTHDLRSLASAFSLERAAGASLQSNDDIITEILLPLQAGSELRPPDHSSWVEAIAIGRALVILSHSRRPDQRREAVANAATRLRARGFSIDVKEGRLDRASQTLPQISVAISDHLERLGLMSCLSNVMGVARDNTVYAFDQYLFGRRYSTGPRQPSIPFGFLLNLAVRIPDQPVSSEKPQDDWREAVELAKDLAAIIDVEQYNRFWLIGGAPKRIEPMLSEVGLYDHLFSFRQWPLPLTPLLVRSFFGSEHDNTLSERVGWNVADAVQLIETLVGCIRSEPRRLSRGDLMGRGLSREKMDRMLPHFAHPRGRVNEHYNSPLAAKKADLMFRPLIEGENDTYITCATSLIGPACYEVVATAMREGLPANVVSELTGAGTERAVAALLRFRNLTPSFEGAKYNEGQAVDSGECDIVLEDSANVLFIECKGKPLTRATMEGEPGAALLDYGEGVLASQIQALQHERILTTKHEISFDNGPPLELRDRKVTRLSVTLLDHGSLQDRFLFINLVEPFLRSQIIFDPTSPNRKRYKRLNAALDKHRIEMTAAEARSASPWQEALGAASLSFGQLAVILIKDNTVSSLVEQISKPATTVSLNPLLEYHHMRQAG